MSHFKYSIFQTVKKDLICPIVFFSLALSIKWVWRSDPNRSTKKPLFACTRIKEKNKLSRKVDPGNKS